MLKTNFYVYTYTYMIATILRDDLELLLRINQGRLAGGKGEGRPASNDLHREHGFPSCLSSITYILVPRPLSPTLTALSFSLSSSALLHLQDFPSLPLSLLLFD